MLRDRVQQETIVEQNGQLVHDDIPVLFEGPILGDVFDVEIEEFDQGFIMGKDLSIFCIFSKLSIEIFDGVGGVNNFTQFHGVFKKRG